MALDVSQDPQTMNKMILWTKHGQKNQRYKITQQNYKYIITSGNGAVL